MKPEQMTYEEIALHVISGGGYDLFALARAIEAARDAQWAEMLSKQKPIGYIDGDDKQRTLNWDENFRAFSLPVGTKIYAAPQPAERKPLTGEQIRRRWTESMSGGKGETYLPIIEFARAIKKAHGIGEKT